MINEQNTAFIEAAESGAALPTYRWPEQGAPNCPPPADPEGDHMRELERAITLAVKLLQQESRLAPVTDERGELRRQLETGCQFQNDITRLPAFVKYAALQRFFAAGGKTITKGNHQ